MVPSSPPRLAAIRAMSSCSAARLAWSTRPSRPCCSWRRRATSPAISPETSACASGLDDREQLRRGRDDPLGLARQLQGIERGRHPLLRDPPEHPAHLGERVHRRRRGDQGERADAQKGQQQPLAHAHPPQHRDHVAQLPGQTYRGLQPNPACSPGQEFRSGYSS